MSENWHVYVIENMDGKFRYTGMSQNPEDRLKSHNMGKVRPTKHFRPFNLIYSEWVGSRREARERECYLKSAAGRRFVEKQIKKQTGGSLPE